ncbi:hypothetical protein [Deinococcus ruber]|nr:hypothetical protein [Deinococcus ruber]
MMPLHPIQNITKHLLLLAALTGGAAGAIQEVLTAPEIAQANQDGSAMVTPSSAYLWGSYLLVSNSTGIKLAPNAPEVDGIAMGTPFERLRYEAYLSQYEGNPLDTARATAFARTLDHKLSFIVYTHSLKSVAEETEQWQQAYEKNPGARKSTRTASYLDVFKPATLTVNGRTLQASPQVDGPYQDQFNLANGDFDFRYLGVITYTFDLKSFPNARNVTLSFKDSAGRKYTQKIDLSQYH